MNVQCKDCDGWFKENKDGTPRKHKCEYRSAPEPEAPTDSVVEQSVPKFRVR